MDFVAGLDGFFIIFFKKCRDIIKDDLHEAIKFFFIGNIIPSFSTSTTIMLNLLNNKLKYYNDFRLISLFALFNKIILKFLAKRMCVLLPKNIFIYKTWFVNGRSIYDNILIMQELVHAFDLKIKEWPILL